LATASGFGLFYWYSFPRRAAALESLIGGDWQLLIWPGRVLASLIGANFVRMAVSAETEYISETTVALTAAKAKIPLAVLTLIEGPASVKFVGNDKVYPANNSPIDVISLEAHNLYNRMSISKLTYTAKGTSSLNLLGDEWYERNRVEAWLNTTVRYIDRSAKRIDLGTNESLNYDRLILATGSSAQYAQQFPG
jgi:hypothetical protein